jgi:hypothetical protein
LSRLSSAEAFPIKASDQVVKSLGGEVLSERDVWHVYTLANGLIQRMDIEENEPSSERTPFRDGVGETAPR